MGQGSDSIPEDWSDEIEESLRQQEREQNVSYMKRLYAFAKQAPVKSTILCPCCTKKHIKTTYQKVFCNSPKQGKKLGKSSCKDQYWNYVDEKRFDRRFEKGGKGVYFKSEQYETEDYYSNED